MDDFTNIISLFTRGLISVSANSDILLMILQKKYGRDDTDQKPNFTNILNLSPISNEQYKFTDEELHRILGTFMLAGVHNKKPDPQLFARKLFEQTGNRAELADCAIAIDSYFDNYDNFDALTELLGFDNDAANSVYLPQEQSENGQAETRRVNKSGVTEKRSHLMSKDENKLDHAELAPIFGRALSRQFAADLMVEILNRKNLTIREAGAIAGVSHTQIQRIKDGKKSLEKSLPILSKLGCKLTFHAEIS